MPNEGKSGDTEKYDHSDHPTSHSTADDLRGQGTDKTSVSAPENPRNTDAGAEKNPISPKKR